MSLYLLSICLQIDLLWRCLVFASAMMCREECVERMCCRSRIVVCISLVLVGGPPCVGGYRWEGRRGRVCGRKVGQG
jgi:hypothetical protein